MNGGNVRRSDLGRLPLGRWAAGGVLVALAGLLVVVLTSTDKSFLFGGVLVLVGSLAVAAVVVIGVVRRELLGHVEYVNEVVERGVVEVLPPGRVAERLLDRVYGPSPYNQALLTALLGGEGRAGDGGDLTISEHTEIDFRLDSLDDRSYHLVIEQRYSFRNRVPTSKVVIFATSEPLLRDSIISGCRLPLFELWFVREDPDKPRFEESVEAMQRSIHVGLEYADEHGRRHEVPLSDPRDVIREVKVQEWGKYLTFFRSDLTEGLELDRRVYMDRLRIFEIDLHALSGSRHDVETITRLTISSTTIQNITDGFSYWQAPYPCFVEQMTFDTSSFSISENPDLQFSIKPFAVTGAEPPTWNAGKGVAVFPASSWMLPGHGVAFLWRPAAWS
ncbi:hypothetical protein [Actinomycetospora soli]|uniref:hypothetical protein n=1 Tax=Actinomycetospora soli TaxID=2893887 RepID=UPI001E3C53D1|nr:hypothetical protein [Actinomycetospora soli]MCD2187751.1 hypothetical protein [Actinomycetospora soli]